MTVEYAAATSFTSRLGGVSVTGAEDLTMRVMPYGELCWPDTDVVQSGVVACWVDMLSGTQVNAIAPERIAMTTALDLTLFKPIRLAPVRLRSAVVKLGRSVSLVEVMIEEDRTDHAALAGIAHVAFSASQRPADRRDAFDTGWDKKLSQRRLSAQVADAIGLISSDGAAELPLSSVVANTAGAMHGGALALVVEAAAQRANRDERSPSSWTSGIRLKFLNAVRRGPAVGRSDELAAGFHRVEVREEDSPRGPAAISLISVRPCIL
jgi:acyl-coenzyme A thioesterase PaaI-like protein